jgi:peptidoglycan/LPS O-acetylase OafA/YrhL
VLLADTSIRQVSIYAPMGLAQSMKMFLLGIITRQFVDFNKIGSTVILSLVFLGVTSLYFVLIDSLNRRFLDNIFSLVLPVVFFMLVLSIKKILSKLKILLLLGKYSLQIYLIHVIIYNCFLGIILHKTHTPDKIIGGIVFMLTLAISLVIGIILTKWKFFNKYIFSKEYKNIVGKKSNQI